MHDLAQRAHVNVRTVRRKPFVIYDDHRFLVSVLWHAMHRAQEGQRLSVPPLLITFDYHDDARELNANIINRLAAFRQNVPTERELFDFVEWELDTNDGDWLKAAMELGVVGNAINIGGESTSNLDGFETTYQDRQGVEHRIWRVADLHSALDYQGELSDTARSSEFQPMWSTLGWTPQPGPRQLEDPGVPIVLDFDLDCFTGDLSGCRTAWPGELIESRFVRTSNHNGTHGWNARTLLDELEERIAFRSIALETACSGGYFQSIGILDALDVTLWDSELRNGYLT